MSVMNTLDLLNHLDHQVEIAYYGYGDKNDPASVTIECMTCGEVLLELRDDQDGYIELGAIEEDLS